MIRIITPQIVCITALVMMAVADGISFTETEKNYIEYMNEKFCGQDRMCSKSSVTNIGSCRICPGCHCDDQCDKYGDCCADKALEHLGTPNFHPSRYRCSSNAFKLIYDKKAGFAFHSIQKCSIRTDEELVKLCESPDPSNITLAVPAETATELYRNQFCAECNGDTEFRLWAIKAQCTQLVWLRPGMTSLQIIQTFIDDIGCAIFLQPPKDSNMRQCYTPIEITSSCNITGKWQEYNDTTEKSCLGYSAPIHLFGDTYRNVFCYMCNHGDLDDNFLPMPSCPFDMPYPFSVVMDPEAIKMVQHTTALSCECPAGTIYDNNTEECRQIQCTGDRILRDEACFSVIRSAKGMVYYSEVLLRPTTSLVVPDNIKTWLTATADQLKDHLKAVLDIDTFAIGLFRFRAHVKRESGNSASTVQYISLHTKFLINWESEIGDMESTLLELRESVWSVTLGVSNVTFTAEPVWTDPDNNNTFPKLTTETLDETTSIYTLDIGKIIDFNNPLYVAATLQCPRVKVFQDVDYTYDEVTNTMQRTGSNQTIDISQFEPSTNNSGFVCYSAIFDNGTTCGGTVTLSSTSMSSGTLFYVSMVCLTLTLICLLLTFLVYCIYKPLRTLSGKNTMGLVFTLLVALLLYTLGSARVEQPMMCRVTGMVTHFFLLSSFTWMSICTIHTYVAFKNLLLSRHAGYSNRKRYVLYVFISIIIPGAIVAGTVAVNHSLSDGLDTGYGTSICYVSNFLSVLLAVGVPVAIIMAINGGLFVTTALTMRKLAKEQQELKSKKSSISLYAQLSILTGITWFFALVSVLVDSEVYKYIFVILCVVKGVYIFVSFVCTKRVFDLMRGCCMGRSLLEPSSMVTDDIKMTFSGKELDIEELEEDKDNNYASIKEMRDHTESVSVSQDGVDNDTYNTIGAYKDEDDASRGTSDCDTLKVNSSCRGAADTEHVVDMHTPAGDDDHYGLLMNSTTKEIRNPCNVMFNPVFK
ncbi:uncharacterized protein LOC124141001 [Haliotis rufescens]|uniref:uncharacterized protein LOC124141001 n=1 Tax=Haliotis rufescens TaxID=6454 RepID=UPI00201F1587|nr:uncharacterized protein LOC124141001 [Haliotis rufescens]